MRKTNRPTLTLPDSGREELKEMLGPVISDEDISKHIRGQDLAAVGDVVTAHLIKAGHVPKLMIVDFKTKRSDERPLDKGVREHAKNIIKVENPPAQITTALWDAIERAYRAKGPTLIVVDGEEDLASLVCIVSAPDGSLVVYGVPGKGMTVVTVNEYTKGRSQKALDSMKKVKS